MNNNKTTHVFVFFFFFNDTATTEIYTLSLHDALPISAWTPISRLPRSSSRRTCHHARSEEHTSELQSRFDLVCRLLLEKKKKHSCFSFFFIKKRCDNRRIRNGCCI